MVFDLVAFEEVAAKVGKFLEAEFDLADQKCIVKRARRFKVLEKGEVRNCSADFEIRFSSCQEDGTTLNKAEICLMPEEYSVFIRTLMQHAISFPTHYTQWVSTDLNVYCIMLESFEPPEHFAERLAAALKVVDR